MKKHFNIKYKEQILSGELSVITGSDTPVRIIFIDDDVNHNDYPVYGFIKEEKTMFRWSLDGHIYEFDIEPSNLGKFNYDLYLIKTSNELTEFEQHLECICEEYMKLGTEYDSWDKTDEWIRNKAAKLKETFMNEDEEKCSYETTVEDELDKNWMGIEAFPEGTDITPLPKAMKIVEKTAYHFFDMGVKFEQAVNSAKKEYKEDKFLPRHWYKCLQDFPDSPGMQKLFHKDRYYRASEEYENYMCYIGGAMYIPANKKSVVFSLVEFEFTVGHWYKAISNWGDSVVKGQIWLCHKDGWLTHGATDVRSDLGPNYFTPATDEEVHNDNKYNIGDIVNYHKSHNAVVKFLNILGIDDRGYYAEALKQDVANSLHFIKTKHFEVIPLNHYSFMKLVKD